MGKVKSTLEFYVDECSRLDSCVREAEMRIAWYEQALRKISSPQVESVLACRKIARTYLDGEPTTADEYNDPTLLRNILKKEEKGDDQC